MSYSREDFRNYVVRNRIITLEALKENCSKEALEKGFSENYGVPLDQLFAWHRRMFRTPKLKCECPGAWRLVNHFKLGADPEFIFEGVLEKPEPKKLDFVEAMIGRKVAEKGQRIDANVLGLKQGPAFGADNNGRLAEIRPHPSKSALEVCASIMTTMKWLYLLEPQTRVLAWRCGAFLLNDGLGGHVHFGRRRITSPKKEKQRLVIKGKGKEQVAEVIPARKSPELEALGYLYVALSNMRMYPYEECVARANGDARGQKYGLPDDFRPQNHGYEYRAFPSWLDSPELAFFSITLAKLAVHQPGIMAVLKDLRDPVLIRQALVAILAFFKDLDDDARIAYRWYLRKGFPEHRGGDFKGRWGIGEGLRLESKPPRIVPLTIKGDRGDLESLYKYLSFDLQIVKSVPRCEWNIELPKGYYPIIEKARTVGAKGLGEAIWDLVTQKGCPWYVMYGGNLRRAIYVPANLHIDKAWFRVFKDIDPGVHFVNSGKEAIQISSELLKDQKSVRALRAILLSGAFPIWRAQEVKPESWELWCAGQKGLGAEKSEKKYAARLIGEARSPERQVKKPKEPYLDYVNEIWGPERVAPQPPRPIQPGEIRDIRDIEFFGEREQ